MLDCWLGAGPPTGGHSALGRVCGRGKRTLPACVPMRAIDAHGSEPQVRTEIVLEEDDGHHEGRKELTESSARPAPGLRIKMEGAGRSATLNFVAR